MDNGFGSCHVAAARNGRLAFQKPQQTSMAHINWMGANANAEIQLKQCKLYCE